LEYSGFFKQIIFCKETMNLAQAKVAFLEERQQHLESDASIASLEMLCSHFAGDALTDIFPEKLRQFLSLWYLEEAVTHSTSSNQTGNFPDAQTMIASLTDFFTWAHKIGVDNFQAKDLSQEVISESSEEAIARERLAVLQNLQETLPRAIAITGRCPILWQIAAERLLFLNFSPLL